MLVAGVIATTCFVVISALVAVGATDGIDEWWNDAMIDAETSWLVDVADVFRVLGSTTVAILLALVGVIGFAVLRRYRDAITLAVIAVVAFAISQIVKSLVDRERPPNPIDAETSASYPSASVMVSAAAIVLGAAVLASRVWPLQRWMVPAATTYVVLMALSRTYLRAHWLFDVLGGAAGGVAVVTLVVAGSTVLAMRSKERTVAT